MEKSANGMPQLSALQTWGAGNPSRYSNGIEDAGQRALAFAEAKVELKMPISVGCRLVLLAAGEECGLPPDME